MLYFMTSMTKFTPQQIITRLKAKAKPGAVEGMAKFGMTAANRLGVAVPDMRALAREIGRDHTLALALWKTGIAEAKITASMIGVAGELTAAQMEAWVKDFDSWDVCDQVCMNLFDKSPLAWEKVQAWAGRDEEFVKRAAFALIACLAWHDKSAPDRAFLEFLPLIKKASGDGRNFVRKAVNWALRHIGKRNEALRREAVALALELKAADSKTARWIGADAFRELSSAAVKKRTAERVRRTNPN
jgi:3-methyladenine DNA glycosylase AlkD